MFRLFAKIVMILYAVYATWLFVKHNDYAKGTYFMAEAILLGVLFQL